MDRPAEVRTDWVRRQARGQAFLASELLLEIPGLVHGFSLARDAAGQRFDAGSAEPGDARAAAARAAFGAALDAGGPPRVLRQVHGARIVDAASVDPGGPPEEADGWILGRDEARCGPVAVRTADCVPLLLADRDGRAAAAIHAGWRGVAAGIGPAAVARLAGLGIPPERQVAALGPAIAADRYPVGPEVVEALARTLPGDDTDWWRRDEGGTLRVDVRAALRRQLLAAGLRASAIAVSPHCTWDGPGAFFSYRRDGAAAGRLIAAIGWRAASPDPA